MTKWDPFWNGWLKHKYFSGDAKVNLLSICKNLAEIAKEEGYTQAQLVLARVIASKDVSTMILGFSKILQLDENVKALELYQRWNRSLETKIEA